MSITIIDRILDVVCNRNADAVAFKVGDFPRMYQAGKSMRFAGIKAPITEKEVWEVAHCLIPADRLTDPGIERVTTSFDYGGRARFTVEFERGVEGTRVVIWRREKPR